MTGQLFVVPQGGHEDPYVRLVLALEDGREIRFRDIRKFGRIGLYLAGGRTRSRAIGPEPLSDAFTVKRLPPPPPGRGRAGSSRCCSTSRSSPASATSTPTRRCGRRASIRSGRRGRCARRTSDGSGREVRRILAEAVIRRGSSIDDYTAPDGDGEMQDHLEVYQRTGEPCRRCGRPIRRIVVGGRATHFCSWCQRLPAADRAGARAILRTMSRPERAGPALVGAAGRGGERRACRRRRTRRRAAGRRGRSGRGGPPPPGARRPAPRSAAEPMSILRLEHVRREVGTFVILDDDHRRDRGRRSDRARRAERRRQDDPAPDRRRSRRARRRRRPPQARADDRAARPGVALRRRVHGRRRTSGPPSVTAPPTSRRWASAWPSSRQPAGSRSAAYADLQHQFEILGGYTLDLRVDEALSGLGFARDEWAKPPTALSGGEQTRATLARLVIAQPDLLLLDEPTNHLDIGAIEWLEEHLRRRHGALLVASHDRAFLDATVGRDLGAARPEADGVPGRLQRLPPPARGAGRAGGQGRRHPGRRDRAREGARPALPVAPQVQQDARARGAARAPPGGPGRDAEVVAPAAAAGRGPRRRRRLAIRRDRRPGRGARGRLPAGPGRARRRRPPGDGASTGRRGAVPRGAAGRPDRDRRAERGGQDDAAPDDRRRPAAARRDR